MYESLKHSGLEICVTVALKLPHNSKEIVHLHANACL